ncbi:MAG TPA: hypothetical protein VFX30_13385 [bacterium]|nr:hypothetical protein [bacterium]
MKKVLIIGYFWPYIYGSARIVGLANHLNAFGWYPIVVTAPLSQQLTSPNYRVVEVPFPGDVWEFWRKILVKLGFSTSRSLLTQLKEKAGAEGEKSWLDRLLMLYQEILAYPGVEKKWKKPALRACREIVASEGVQAILSNFPFTSHVVARQLKEEFSLPWLADFPDLWSQNHYYTYGKLRHWFDERLEVKTLKSADLLTTVSDNWADKLKRLHPGAKVLGITHGYDPAIVNEPPAPLLPKFTITYTGTIYPGMQDPEPFFEAVGDLLRDGTIPRDAIEIRFYSDQETWLKPTIREHGVSDVVFLLDRTEKSEIVHRHRESHLLMVLDTNDDERGWHSLKIFDYLAAKRPVLIVGGAPNNALVELVAEIGAGEHGQTAAEVKDIISRAYATFVKTGSVPYRGDQEALERYSHTVKVKQFADLLNDISQSGGKIELATKS